MKSSQMRCTILLVAGSCVLALLPTSQKKSRNWNTLETTASGRLALLVVPAAAWRVQAQDAETSYPSMAPLDQYLMERDAEITLARSAAPEAISRDAKVMVLGARGYETAVKGKNDFVCLVERSWSAGIDDPEFWNPKGRAPICFNAPAARFNVPLLMKKTELVLAGRTKTQLFEAVSASLDKKELPTLEGGAMCYMMSKQQWLNRDGHWHPHLMFFVPLMEGASWGAGSPGSPVVNAFIDTPERHTVFLITVANWSDGTPASHE